MFGSLFKRPLRPVEFSCSSLGRSAIALPAPANCTVPPGCAAVLVDRGGRTRRLGEGARIAVLDGERAWGVHPGPYSCDLTPFAASPEIGLRLSFAIDPDPRASQQRFDLYLASEAEDAVGVEAFAQVLEAALQHELAQGNLDLPPCTTLEEWNAFRAGINQLMYTRFGVTVDDCVPVDLGASRDYARMLEARLAAQAALPAAALAPEPVSELAPGTQEAFCAAREDARALRRLFLELPCVMCALRMAVTPEGQAQFRQLQELLRRLDLVSLSVGTMPALELSAPNTPLPAGEQMRRARHSRRAALALDEAWALLARIKQATGATPAALFDEADRIVSNLELEAGARRALRAPELDEVAA
ncbi:hypothetical protein B0920_08020 [Massilia sp. KIM]|uniref:hypothetical protein n=1 Tax=Massilia sp. KIM TaxID=1955422 RepID=UPI00098F8B7B|nr:hypothetical protein [Massilia sp. KIM]OON63328.1 hypothetical protein B0920_08020 [Massilia sp. KIM]